MGGLSVLVVVQSAIAYDGTVKTLFPPASLSGEPYVEYEFEPDTKSEVLDDMYEMAVATTIFTSMLESAAAEQSSRMTAMENASKNGEQLIKDLSIQYNRCVPPHGRANECHVPIVLPPL